MEQIQQDSLTTTSSPLASEKGLGSRSITPPSFVIVEPGDDSWQGYVEVPVSEDTTLGGVKAAVAKLVGRPDIEKSAKLVRIKDNGDRMVLKDSALLGKRTRVRLVSADGMQWPPKPLKVTVRDAAGNSAMVDILSDATVGQVESAFCSKFKIYLHGQLGLRDDFNNFTPLGDQAHLGAHRVLFLEGDDLKHIRTANTLKLQRQGDPMASHELLFHEKEAQDMMTSGTACLESFEYF